MQISVDELEVGIRIRIHVVIQEFCGNHLEDERRQRLTDLNCKIANTCSLDRAEEQRGVSEMKCLRQVFSPRQACAFQMKCF